jgi:hypothetical protein
MNGAGGDRRPRRWSMYLRPSSWPRARHHRGDDLFPPRASDALPSVAPSIALFCLLDTVRKPVGGPCRKRREGSRRAGASPRAARQRVVRPQPAVRRLARARCLWGKATPCAPVRFADCVEPDSLWGRLGKRYSRLRVHATSGYRSRLTRHTWRTPFDRSGHSPFHAPRQPLYFW